MIVECEVCGVLVESKQYKKHKGSRKCLVLGVMPQAKGLTMSEVNKLLREKGEFWTEYWKAKRLQDEFWTEMAQEAGYD